MAAQLTNYNGGPLNGGRPVDPDRIYPRPNLGVGVHQRSAKRHDACRRGRGFILCWRSCSVFGGETGATIGLVDPAPGFPDINFSRDQLEMMVHPPI